MFRFGDLRRFVNITVPAFGACCSVFSRLDTSCETQSQLTENNSRSSGPLCFLREALFGGCNRCSLQTPTPSAFTATHRPIHFESSSSGEIDDSKENNDVQWFIVGAMPYCTSPSSRWPEETCGHPTPQLYRKLNRSVVLYARRKAFIKSERLFSLTSVVACILFLIGILGRPTLSLYNQERNGYSFMVDQQPDRQMYHSSINVSSSSSSSVVFNNYYPHPIHFSTYSDEPSTEDVFIPPEYYAKRGRRDNDRPLVVFYFTSSLNGEHPQLLRIDERTVTFFLEPHDRLLLTCNGRLFGIGGPLVVKWWKDGRTIEGSNATLSISDFVDDLGVYRCLAAVSSVPSSNLLLPLLSANRPSQSGDLPPGSILSSSITVRRTLQTRFIAHPRSVTTSQGSVIRLECAVNAKSKPRPIQWLKDDVSLNKSDRIKIFNFEHSSVLHLINADISDSGRYQCTADNVLSTAGSLTILASRKVSRVKYLLSDSYALIKGLSLDVSVKLGDSILLECLFRDPNTVVSWTAFNHRGEQITLDLGAYDDIGSVTGIILSNVKEKDSGVYTCHSNLNGETKNFSTVLTVKTPPQILSEYSVSRLKKTQGMTTRLHCAANDATNDRLFQITWYKDGYEVLPFGRIKLHPADSFLPDNYLDPDRPATEFLRDLVISSVQQDDEGLYQCVVSNSIGEANSVVALTVDADFDKMITDLKVSTDHVNSQFFLEWTLPSNTDYLQAHSSLFLLTYYLSDGGSANSVALRNVVCMRNNSCRAKCCSLDSVFLPRRNYTFQMSMLMVEKFGISPLSDRVSVLSWDGAAKKALDVYVSMPSQYCIQLKWNRPEEEIINGELQRYEIDFYEGIEFNEFDMRTAGVPPSMNAFNITEVDPDQIYRFRVIPVTRHGRPSPLMLRSNSNFSFFVYHTPKYFEPPAREIKSPTVEVIKNEENVLRLVWDRADKVNISSYDSLRIRYGMISGSLFEEIVKTIPVGEGALELPERFESGVAYQFCGHYVKGSMFGEEYCHLFRMNGKIAEMNYSHRLNLFPQLLPSPVRCEPGTSSECYCVPSEAVGDAMRVFWERSVGDRQEAEEYVVHYSLDENNIQEDDRQVITNETFADLPSLRSNTTYRVMVEARNRIGGVEGLWFNCTTPTLLSIPAPKQVDSVALNATVLEIRWSPVTTNPSWSLPTGYLIEVQPSPGFPSIGTLEFEVDGINTTRHVISLKPNVEYSLRIAARSKNGRTGTWSVPIQIATSGYRFSPKNIKSQLFSKKYREGMLIGAVVFVGLLSLCLAATCARFRFKRKKLQMRAQLRCLTRNIAPIPAHSRSHEMEELLAPRNLILQKSTEICDGIRETDLLSDERSGPQAGISAITEDSECFIDTKGGEDGALPSGHDKCDKLFANRKQLKKFLQLQIANNAKTIRNTSCQNERVQNPLTSLCRTLEADNSIVELGNSEQFTGHIADDECASYRYSSSAAGSSLSSAQSRKISEHRPPKTTINSVRMPGCSRSSTESGTVETLTMPIPCMLSRLTTNPSYMNSHQAMSLPRSFQRSFHIPYSDRQRMTLTRSNSFQLFERKCRLGDARFQQALISFSTIQSPYAAVSLQSLLFDDGNSISHVSYRSPRDTLGNNTVPSSSMPNLSDSGIVYDENHAQNMLIPVANVAVSRHCHYCPS